MNGAEEHFNEHYADPDVDNLRIKSLRALIYPQMLLEELPLSDDSKRTVLRARVLCAKIISGEDDRLIVVVGPCSIHDPKAALEYADKLRVPMVELSGELIVMMRVYFEKPRTTVGWKGLINDPKMDDSFDVNSGFRLSRWLLSSINELGVPCATEFLDTLVPQYIADCVSWAAIGARTTESQLHRQLASGCSMPVGFKNGTSGATQIAVDAVVSAAHPHCFFGLTKQGLPAIVQSKGNPHCHVIMRGGTGGTNFAKQHIDAVSDQLRRAKLREAVMVDCSHGNSSKQHKNQLVVIDDLCDQIEEGSRQIIGVMVESNLQEGRQDVPSTLPASPVLKPLSANAGPAQWLALRGGTDALQYGVSVTDACLSFDDTLPALRKLATAVRARRERCQSAASVD
eukprot:Polyplicarium_translucidae@DN3329_c1_g4_i6.p2